MSAGVTGGNDLNGLRVLVVEDEAAISLLLEDMLLDFGCEVIGPAARLAAALEAVAREKVDLAILDVNVAGEPIYPVAEALVERRCRSCSRPATAAPASRTHTGTGPSCRSPSPSTT